MININSISSFIKYLPEEYSLLSFGVPNVLLDIPLVTIYVTFTNLEIKAFLFYELCSLLKFFRLLLASLTNKHIKHIVKKNHGRKELDLQLVVAELNQNVVVLVQSGFEILRV
mgnify:CR=1 FL=1